MTPKLQAPAQDSAIPMAVEPNRSTSREAGRLVFSGTQVLVASTAGFGLVNLLIWTVVRYWLMAP